MNRGGDTLNENLAADNHTSGRSKQSQPPPNTSELTKISYSMGLSSSRGGQLIMTAVEPALPANRAQAWRDYLPCWDSESSSGTKTLTTALLELMQPRMSTIAASSHLGLPSGFGSSGCRSPHYLTGFVFAKPMSLSVPRRWCCKIVQCRWKRKRFSY